ncbi:MAG TPA: sulfatase, partial [Bacteroidales bacterium]|nr:sulfatase [Bacteroidales bacterium]
MKPVCYKALILLFTLTLTQCGENVYKPDPSNRPNILIVMGDDISFPHMSAYGTSWIKTPGFDRVAEKGIIFYNAFTPDSKSSPARAAFLTGRNSWLLEEAANQNSYFPQKFTTLFEALEKNGYYTGYTAKGWAPGIAETADGKPRLLTGKPLNSKKTSPPSTGISDNDYAGNFEEFLDSREKDKPFCFWYGSEEAGRNFEYGSGVSKGGKKITDINKMHIFFPDNEAVKTDILDYAFEVEYFDSHLTRMLDILEKRGELNNTIVIVTSDNGMSFPRVEGQTYEFSNHVPMAIMWPDVIKNTGRQISDFISLTDIAPTIIEATGITVEQSGMQKFTGKSLMNLFLSGKKGWVDETRNHVIIGSERHEVGRPGDGGYPTRGIIMDGFLYITNYHPERWPAGNPETGYAGCDGSPTKTLILNMQRSRESADYWKSCFGMRPGEELYHLAKDPDCLNNLA